MAAEKSFDPYHLWLGIAPADQPPNHYRLLGTGLFERDDEVIEQAAERQSAHVRTFLATPQAAQAKSLLNKIRLATDCLLTPELKDRYDAALKRQLAGRAATTAEDTAAESPAAKQPVILQAAALDQPPAETESSEPQAAIRPTAADRRPVTEFAPNLQQTSKRRKPVRRSSTPWAMIVGSVLVGVLALGGTAAWLNRSAPPEVISADRPATSAAHSSKSSPPTIVEPEPANTPQVQAVTTKVATAESRPENERAAAATALEFDGKTQYVAIGNPPELNFAGQITLSGWIRPQETKGIHNIVAHGLCWQPSAEIFLRTNDGRYEVGSWNGNNHHAQCAMPPSDIGAWVHLTGMYDGKKWKLFRNGALAGEKADEIGAIPVNERWAIAATGDRKDRYFQGGLADVRIYRRALSDDEVRELFSQSTGDRPDEDDTLSEGLVGHWALDAAADPVVDRSAGGHKGKLIGSPRLVAGPPGNGPSPLHVARVEPAPATPNVEAPAVSESEPPTNPKPTEVTVTVEPKPAPVVVTVGPQQPNPAPGVKVPVPPAGASWGAEFTLVKQLSTGGRLTAFSSDGQWVASGGKGSPELLELHNVRTGKKTMLIDGQHAFLRNLAFTGNSRQLAVVDASGVVTFWDLPGGGVARTVPAPDRFLDGRQFGSDARTVVLHCFNNPAQAGVIADTQNGAELFRVRSPFQHLILVEASPNGRYMLLGGYELINGRTGPERLTLYDLKADRESGTLPESPPGGQFWKVAFSPDSSRIALTTLGYMNRVTIWNVAGRRVEREMLLKSPTGGQASAWAKTFTNDGRQLLTVGNDRTFCLWDVSSGELRAFHRSEQTISYTFLRFAADGRTFCAANESGSADVWQMRVSLPKFAAPVARLAAPSRDQQAAVLQLVKEAFSGEFVKAKKPADKAELARKLLTRAGDAADANERYVILEQARDLAAQAGEAALVCQAIDTLTATYAVDPLPTATAGLELLPRGAAATNQGDLAEGLAAIAERWAARGDLDAASKLAILAVAAARKAKNAELSKSLARQQAGWKEAARSAETVRADQAALAANPDDPAANLSVGKHYCRLDDWASALPLLAKAADENLQRRAADELKASADPQERLRLADAWYDFANAQPRKEQPLFLSHAAALYRQAAPGLKGLLHTKAQKRIEEIEAAGE